MKITKIEFNSLYSDDITKKEYDRVIKKIDSRFSEIMTTLIPSLKKKGWFDYNNCPKAEGSNGHFDPRMYKEEIDLCGEYSDLPEPFVDYIHTRWLWKDFEIEFAEEVAEHKEALEMKKANTKESAQKLKLKKEKLRKSIESKLTEEELKAIKFK